MTKKDDEKRGQKLLEEQAEAREHTAKKRGVKPGEVSVEVYTPVEIVDFMNKSLRHIIKQEFGQDMGNVEYIDPFCGSGIFTERLIEKEMTKDEVKRATFDNIDINPVAVKNANKNINRVYKKKTGKLPDKPIARKSNVFTEYELSLIHI